METALKLFQDIHDQPTHSATSPFSLTHSFQIMTPRTHLQWFITYSTLGTAQRRPLAEGVAFKEEDSHMRTAVVEGSYLM